MAKIKTTIPNGWVVKKLGDLGVCIRGVSYSPEDLMAVRNASSFPLLRSNNIRSDSLDFCDIQIVSKNKVNDKQILRKGDVFICMSNGSRPLVGKNVYIKDNIDSTIGAFCSLYRVQNTDQFSANYIGQLFKTQAYFDQIKNELAGTSINNLKNSTITSLEFLFPPKKEQEKIAEVLSAVDEDIEKTDAVIEKTEKLKKGLMQQLFTKGIGHTKFKKTKLGEIPDGWAYGKFSDLVILRKEKFDPIKNDTQGYVGLEHISQNSGELLGFGDSKNMLSFSSVFHKDDILFGKLRPNLRKYWLAHFGGVCSTEILVFTPKVIQDKDFIFHVVQADNFIESSISKSFGTKMPRTDWSIISEFQLPIPPQSERMKIGQILSSIGERIVSTKKNKEKLIQLKKGLVADLLSGKNRAKV